MRSMMLTSIKDELSCQYIDSIEKMDHVDYEIMLVAAMVDCPVSIDMSHPLAAKSQYWL